MNIGPAAFTVVDLEGDEAENEEETGHSKADAVHGGVAYQLLTVFASLNASTDIFKVGDLNLRKTKHYYNVSVKGDWKKGLAGPHLNPTSPNHVENTRHTVAPKGLTLFSFF